MTYTKQTWTDGSLSTPITAARLAFIESGLDVASPTFNVKAYGAVGNGVADDTTALANAITAAVAVGGVVVSEAGKTYLVASTLTISGSCRFDFNGSTIKKSGSFTAGAKDAAIDVTGTNVTLRNLTVDGNTQAHTTPIGINWSATATGGKAYDCNVINSTGSSLGYAWNILGAGFYGVNLWAINALPTLGTSIGFRVVSTADVTLLNMKAVSHDFGVYAAASDRFTLSGSADECGEGLLAANFGAIQYDWFIPYFKATNGYNFGIRLYDLYRANCGTLEGSKCGETFSTPSATGICIAGCQDSSFDYLVGNMNEGYDVEFISGAVSTCTRCSVGTITSNGSFSPDNDPGVVITDGTTYLSIGVINCFQKTVALTFAEGASAGAKYNTVGILYAQLIPYVAVFFTGGQYNYVGQIITRECFNRSDGLSPHTYPGLVVFNSGSFGCQNNTVGYIDHFNATSPPGGTVTPYTMAYFDATASTNSVVGYSRTTPGNVTALYIDLNGTNTVQCPTGVMNVLTYSTSITPNSAIGDYKIITATNGTAFTINAPLMPANGRVLMFDILNSSGGAMGGITWNGAFKLAGAFTNPASTKHRTITFVYNGTNWIETNRAAVDI